MSPATHAAHEEKNTKQLWLLALDPIHVGTGGTRLSHVDNQIVRDPGDELPKIPATTISGNLRTGAASYWKNKASGNSFCAGVGTKDEPHCGKCPVCRAFGTSREGYERMGALSFSDGLLVMFPLYSPTHGPIWITSHQRRKEYLKDTMGLPAGWQPDKVYCDRKTSLLGLGRRLTVPAQEQIDIRLSGSLISLANSTLAVVPDDLFSMLVNENLEVRTSVSIDPLTGTARSGALFTYEALPRTSILQGQVTLNPDRWNYNHADENGQTENPFTLLEAGSQSVALAGLGGMTTRGFGRITISLEEK